MDERIDISFTFWTQLDVIHVEKIVDDNFFHQFISISASGDSILNEWNYVE